MIIVLEGYKDLETLRKRVIDVAFGRVNSEDREVILYVTQEEADNFMRDCENEKNYVESTPAPDEISGYKILSSKMVSGGTIKLQIKRW